MKFLFQSLAFSEWWWRRNIFWLKLWPKKLFFSQSSSFFFKALKAKCLLFPNDDEKEIFCGKKSGPKSFFFTIIKKDEVSFSKPWRQKVCFFPMMQKESFIASPQKSFENPVNTKGLVGTTNKQEMNPGRKTSSHLRQFIKHMPRCSVLVSKGLGSSTSGSATCRTQKPGKGGGEPTKGGETHEVSPTLVV